MSIPHIKLRLQAKTEVIEIAHYLAERNTAAAQGFHESLQDAFEKLAANPGMGAKRIAQNPMLRGLRSWPLRGYRNYLIFYIPLPDGGIDVLHVLHSARNIEAMIDLA